MRHLEWLVQLCFMWHVTKIIKTHGAMLSKETIFQLQKYPAVNGEQGDEVIKNIPKKCYDKDAHDDEVGIGTVYSSSSSSNNQNGSHNNEMLNNFKNILQQTQKTECEQIEMKEVQELHKGNSEVEKEVQGSQFSILQQLRLDEHKQKWQQQQKKQQIKLQQQHNALKLQHIMQQLDVEGLGKADKKKRKKKKKKKKKRKKKKPVKDKKKKKRKKNKPVQHQSPLLAHPAHILFASPTQKPLHYYYQHDDDHYYNRVTTTTKKPYLHQSLVPLKKIKYILRKNTIFKKKKKQYLNHLKHVLYPFVKFIAFFTIINPFTLAVFLFSLISPVVFGVIGFIGLSFLIKPALHLLFGVKQTVNAIKRKKIQELRKRQRLRDSRRPITIHKHYYQQKPLALPPAHHHRQQLPPPAVGKQKGPVRHFHRLGNRHHHHPRQIKSFNPLLPDVRQKLKKAKHLIPDFKGCKDSFERI